MAIAICRKGRQCVTDIESIFANVYHYYKPEDKMLEMAQGLEQYFKTKLNTMPSGERVIGQRNTLVKDDSAKEANVKSSDSPRKTAGKISQVGD